MVKNSPANAEDIQVMGSIPGLGRSQGGGNVNLFQYSCLASRCFLANSGSSHIPILLTVFMMEECLILEKAMTIHSSTLACNIPRSGEPGGLPSMGSHRVGRN